MFRKKQKISKVTETNKEKECHDEIVHDSPQICLFDFEPSVAAAFKASSYNCTVGSLGKLVRVPNNSRNEQHFLHLNHFSPNNLHEYDILVFNMDCDDEVEYDGKQISLDNVTGQSAHALLSEFPEKIFNPKPFGTQFISKKINDILKKESIVIIFADESESVTYGIVEINSSRNRIAEEKKINNTCFYSEFPRCVNKFGLKMNLPKKSTKFDSLLLKYSNESSYNLVFNHPTHWKDNVEVKNNLFVPLLLNNDDEIISFVHKVSKGTVFVFPCIKDKEGFLLELFNNYLSATLPTLFPFHGQFGWLDNGDYLLPGEADLRKERDSIEKHHVKDVEKNENAVEELKKEFKFLRDLISESGDKLVIAVEHYLKWLGFPSVINFDETNPDILEEDIQVDCGDKFLVIEIKGIGGTSTDKDCSQVSKIKNRRAEQRDKFDVFGLYIVNHQRYMPPESRKNPPFSENQLIDAKLDKRGLLTTYELYKSYFWVEEGILTKEEIRNRLFDYRLIELKPNNLISLGIPDELFMDGHVAILNLNGTLLKKGMDMIVSKNGGFKKVKILSLEVNDVEIDEIANGEVGIKFNEVIKKNSELFLAKV